MANPIIPRSAITQARADAVLASKPQLDKATFENLFYKPRVDASDLANVQELLRGAWMKMSPHDEKALKRVEAALTKEIAAQPLLDAAEHAFAAGAIDEATYQSVTTGKPTFGNLRELASAAAVIDAALAATMQKAAGGGAAGAKSVERAREVAALQLETLRAVEAGIRQIGLPRGNEI